MTYGVPTYGVPDYDDSDVTVIPSSQSSQFITPQSASATAFVENAPTSSCHLNDGFNGNHCPIPTCSSQAQTRVHHFETLEHQVPFPANQFCAQHLDNNNVPCAQPPELVSHSNCPTVSNASMRIRMPDQFDGERENFRGFMAQVNLVFLLTPQHYPNDATKIGFIALLLKGRALKWITPYLAQKDRYAHILSHFDTFIKVFTEAFGDPDRAHVSASKLTQLHQGRDSVTNYVTNFRTLAADLDWPDAPLMHFFEAGLRQDYREMLVHHQKPLTLNALISLVHAIDARIMEHRNGTKIPYTGGQRFSLPRFTGSPPVAWSPATKPSPSVLPKDQQTMTSPTRDDPMDIGQGRVASSNRVKWIATEEKNRRKSKGLCAYCADPNHQVDRCPARTQRRKSFDGNAGDTNYDEQGKDYGQ